MISLSLCHIVPTQKSVKMWQLSYIITLLGEINLSSILSLVVTQLSLCGMCYLFTKVSL